MSLPEFLAIGTQLWQGGVPAGQADTIQRLLNAAVERALDKRLNPGNGRLITPETAGDLSRYRPPEQPRNGTNGFDGRDGLSGAPGVAGVGFFGPPGIPGKDGTVGPEGAGGRDGITTVIPGGGGGGGVDLGPLWDAIRKLQKKQEEKDKEKEKECFGTSICSVLDQQGKAIKKLEKKIDKLEDDISDLKKELRQIKKKLDNTVEC